jgi:hypothetical protein
VAAISAKGSSSPKKKSSDADDSGAGVGAGTGVGAGEGTTGSSGCASLWLPEPIPGLPAIHSFFRESQYRQRLPALPVFLLPEEMPLFLTPLHR